MKKTNQRMTPRNKFQLHIERENILRAETVLLIVVCIFTVTIAWFVLLDSATVQGLLLGASDDEYIRVTLESKETNSEIQDVKYYQSLDKTDQDSQKQYIEIQMKDFQNVEKLPGQEDSDVMAPGVYGQFTLYITSKSPLADQCKIALESLPNYSSHASDDDSDDSDADTDADNADSNADVDDTVADDDSDTDDTLQQLLKGHIQFYASYDATNGYSGLITKENPLCVKDLEQDVEKEVTIYWVWFYEYTDIPQEALTSDAFGPENYFDMEKYNKKYSADTSDFHDVASASERLSDYIEFYDYGDTRIGLGVSDVTFRITLDAISEPEEETNTDENVDDENTTGTDGNVDDGNVSGTDENTDNGNVSDTHENADNGGLSDPEQSGSADSDDEPVS